MAKRQATVYLVDAMFAVRADNREAALEILKARLREGARVKLRRSRFCGKAETVWDGVAHVEAALVPEDAQGLTP